MRKALTGGVLVAVVGGGCAVPSERARPVASAAAGCKAGSPEPAQDRGLLVRRTPAAGHRLWLGKHPHRQHQEAVAPHDRLGQHRGRDLPRPRMAGGCSLRWRSAQWAYGVYPGADGKAQPRGSGTAQGWGVAAASISHGTMSVRALACRKNSPWAGLKLLLSLPLPIPYTASLIQWGASLLIPGDNVKCSDLGYDTLRISATRSGGLSVRETHYYLQGWYTSVHESSNVTIVRELLGPPSIRLPRRSGICMGAERRRIAITACAFSSHWRMEGIPKPWWKWERSILPACARPMISRLLIAGLRWLCAKIRPTKRFRMICKNSGEK